MATTLSVTARGQITLKKEILRHMGIKPGEKIQLDLLPEGKIGLRAEENKKLPLSKLVGCLKNKTNGTVLTIDEINEAIAEAGAEAGMAGLKR
jgi:bifunctional DNA-binding transcriptional regulator/antitoxin component of YhaV-PrlF toxin-antitoxin module